MTLKSSLEKLNEQIKDLSSLHVQTFTGKVTFTGTGNFTDIETAVQQAVSSQTVKLVAESLYKFDGDSYNFLTNDEGGIPASAMELHKSAIEGGIKTRQALAELVKGAFD
ncbi:hypothetical protein GTH32_18695 [Alteromonas sp. 345S023]|jgi:hypothetical protein|uniref:Uncharacterized protein n=1 Tax=Alteromonas profundi TaxID=2696062 RepID=A0A7X5LPJ9_9ALTE|nr:hypothetical protein [Alteromonas profundi]NDV93203.1 hypothetical protein [Alteromonas profundi]